MSDSMYCSSDLLNLEPTLEIFENDLTSGSIIRVLKPESDIGIESLPDKYVERVVKHQTIPFNIMLLGQTGIGKSTLIDSLFKTNFTDDSDRSHSLSEVDVVVNYYDLKEKNINLKLGVIESKGFGDQIIRDESYKPIVEYIDKQFDNFLTEELKEERNPQPENTRVHVCLYLISPVGHGLKPLDLLTMKKLDSKVNLIPVIANSDLITKPELTAFKSNIMSEIESNDINIYRFPTDTLQDSQIVTENEYKLPFAIVASNEFALIDEKWVRARQYPWGTVEVENENHCEFKLLREMILRINLNDFKETTHYQHYEQYRSQRLEELWIERQLEHKKQLSSKERELIDSFTTKFKAKERELKNAEKDLHQRFERLSKERIEEKMRLDLDRQRLEDDIRALKARKQILFEHKTNSQDSTERKQTSTHYFKHK